MRRSAIMIAAVGMALGALLAPGLALALTIDDITVSWTGVVGGAGTVVNPVAYSDNGVAVRWGTALTSGGKSGLGFDPAMPPSFLVPVGSFSLGTLTHFNQTIATGTAVSAATLNLLIDFSSPSLPDLAMAIPFTVNETPNAGPCPVGVPPCADIITFTDPSASVAFDIFEPGLKHHFVLYVDGFSGSSSFISPEGSNNDKTLDAHMTEEVTPIEAPNPSAALLVGLGLLGLGAAGRFIRRQK